MADEKRRFVKVLWLDAQDSGQTWMTDEEIPEFTHDACEVVSWGYLVGATKKYVTLAADSIVNGPYGRVMKVPTAMVVRIEDFKDE